MAAALVLRRLPPAKSLKNQLDLIDSLIELIIINRIVGIINVIRPIAIADLPLDLNPETTLEPVAPEAMVIHEVQRHVIIEVRVEVAVDLLAQKMKSILMRFVQHFSPLSSIILVHKNNSDRLVMCNTESILLYLHYRC